MSVVICPLLGEGTPTTLRHPISTAGYVAKEVQHTHTHTYIRHGRCDAAIRPAAVHELIPNAPSPLCASSKTHFPPFGCHAIVRLGRRAFQRRVPCPPSRCDVADSACVPYSIASLIPCLGAIGAAYLHTRLLAPRPSGVFVFFWHGFPRFCKNLSIFGRERPTFPIHAHHARRNTHSITQAGDCGPADSAEGHWFESSGLSWLLPSVGANRGDSTRRLHRSGR